MLISIEKKDCFVVQKSAIKNPLALIQRRGNENNEHYLCKWVMVFDDVNYYRKRDFKMANPKEFQVQQKSLHLQAQPFQ